MAARHAGFAFVCGTTEGLINSLIEAAFNSVEPIRLNVPSPVRVGGRAISLSGEITVLPPQVTLRRRPDNLVQVHCRFVAEVRLEGATPDPVDVLLSLHSTIMVGIATPIVNGRFVVGLDLAHATVDDVTVVVSEGALGSAYGAAIRSAPILSALTAALRAVPPRLVRVTMDGIDATNRIAPKQMPCGASLFDVPELFSASITVSRVVARVLDGELTLGVDIAGHSRGDVNALGSVFDNSAAVVWARENANTWRGLSINRRGNVGVSINPATIQSIVGGTLNAATRDAFVDCHVALDNISLTLGRFVPKLTTRWIEGASVQVDASYYPSPGRGPDSRLVRRGTSISARATSNVAFHLQTWDGDTAFLSRHADYWFIKVYDTELELPWWVTAGLILLAIAQPVFLLPVITLVDGIIPSLLGNLSTTIQARVQSGIDKAASESTLMAARSTRALPGIPGTPAEMRTRLLALSGDGLDAYADCTLDNSKDSRPDRSLVVTADGERVRDGEAIFREVADLRRLPCTLKINPGVVPELDPTVRVRWEVRRTDTHQVVAQKDLPLHAARFAGGAVLAVAQNPLRIDVDRSDSALMPVDVFRVIVRLYRPLYGRTKEFGACAFEVRIRDRFDRHRPYVRWSHWAAGVPQQSALHRTAVPGRCTMLTKATRNRAAAFEYLDVLPFPTNRAGAIRPSEAQRAELCDYCFYGGPDKDELIV